MPAPWDWLWIQLPERANGPDPKRTWFRRRMTGIISRSDIATWTRALAGPHEVASLWLQRDQPGDGKCWSPDTTTLSCFCICETLGTSPQTCLTAAECLAVCSPREGQKHWVSMVGHRHPAWWGRNNPDVKNPSWKTKTVDEEQTFLSASYGLLPGVYQPRQLVHMLCRFPAMLSPC